MKYVNSQMGCYSKLSLCRCGAASRILAAVAVLLAQAIALAFPAGVVIIRASFVGAGFAFATLVIHAAVAVCLALVIALARILGTVMGDLIAPEPSASGRYSNALISNGNRAHATFEACLLVIRFLRFLRWAFQSHGIAVIFTTGLLIAVARTTALLRHRKAFVVKVVRAPLHAGCNALLCIRLTRSVTDIRRERVVLLAIAYPA